MSQVTIEQIQELRERTGVGMAQCKKALVDNQGDMEAAIQALRKAGLASAVKKEGRSALQGKIVDKESENELFLLEVNAETDFVAQNERFISYSSSVIEELASGKATNVEEFLAQKYSQDPTLTIDQHRATIVQMIGEHIKIGRLLRIKKNPNSSYALYSHLGGKVVVLVQISGSDRVQDLARDIALHIAAAAPLCIQPSDVSPQLLEQERAIAREQMKDKPPQMLEKIIENKLSTYLDGVCCLRQKYIRDESLTIAALLERKGKELALPLTLERFVRWQVGERASAEG